MGSEMCIRDRHKMTDLNNPSFSTETIQTLPLSLLNTLFDPRPAIFRPPRPFSATSLFFTNNFRSFSVNDKSKWISSFKRNCGAASVGE